MLIASKTLNRILLLDRTSIIEVPKSGVELAGIAVLGDNTPSFTFASLDSPPRLQCTLDGGAPFACPSPFTLPAVADGSHTLQVWENGHDVEPPDLPWSSPPDPTPAVFKFYVDTTGPDAVNLREPAADASGRRSTSRGRSAACCRSARSPTAACRCGDPCARR